MNIPASVFGLLLAVALLTLNYLFAKLGRPSSLWLMRDILGLM